MNILIVGPGAMGCLFAARLSRAGEKVILIDYKPERAERLNKQGILVEGISGEYSSHVRVLVDGIPFTPDVVLICVKANKTKEAGASQGN